MSSLSKKVFITILNWNNFPDTINCIKSVLKSKIENLNFDVLVIDNGSTDESPKQLRLFIENYNRQKNRHGLKLEFIQNLENLGYAGGNNIGILKALENNADFIFILNNDTTIEENTIERLIHTIESNDVAIVGPLIKENTQNNDGWVIKGGKIQWLRSELKHKTWNTKPTTYNLQPNEYIPGAAMLVKKEVFEKIGLLPNEYFLYFEDADFCLRAQMAGFKISHKVSSSTSKLGSSLLLRYHFRNALYFNKKYSPLWVKILLWPWSLWIIGKQILKLLIRYKTQESEAILYGVLDFYRNHTGQIQNSKIKS